VTTSRAVADFTQLRGRHLRVEPHGPHWLEARHGEAWSRRQEYEVARLERESTLAVYGETTAPFQHGAEAWVAEGRVGDAPATGAADASREHGARLQQRDDFRERVGHVWTITNEIRTPRCRKSDSTRP
jgi:hypothetical protein